MENACVCGLTNHSPFVTVQSSNKRGFIGVTNLSAPSGHLPLKGEARGYHSSWLPFLRGAVTEGD